MAVYLATRREVNTQAPQLSHGREAALKKGKRKPEKPASPPHRRILGHACPGKKLFPGHVPLGHVRHARLHTLLLHQGSGVLVGRVWCYPVKNGGRVWVERRRRTSSEGGWVWCRPPPAMPPPRAALSGPSPLSRREESRSGGRLLLLRHIEDVLRTKKEKDRVCSGWRGSQPEQTA